MAIFQNLVSNFKNAFITAKVAENDFVIFVVGPTGSGKSWFTKELCKNDEIQVGEKGQHPRTKYVQALRCNFKNDLNNIIVVDTPSFHTELEGFDAEKVTTDWIKSRYTKECRGSGILFLHPLARDPTHHDMLMTRHLETFLTTFPNGFAVPSCVYVVPTKEPASILKEEKVNQQLEKLKSTVATLDNNSNGKWRVSMFDKVFKGRPETAWEVAQLLLREIEPASVRR